MPRTSTISTLVSAWIATTHGDTPQQAMDAENKPLFDKDGKPVYQILEDSPEFDRNELADMGKMTVADIPENLRERLAGLKEPVIVYAVGDDEDKSYEAWYLDAAETREARLRAIKAREKKSSRLSADKKALKYMAAAKAQYIVAVGRALSVGCNTEQLQPHEIRLSAAGMVKNPDKFIKAYELAYPKPEPETQEKETGENGPDSTDTGDGETATE